MKSYTMDWLYYNKISDINFSGFLVNPKKKYIIKPRIQSEEQEIKNCHIHILACTGSMQTINSNYS